MAEEIERICAAHAARLPSAIARIAPLLAQFDLKSA
jgi:hypothetical protein